ncbi:MAG: HAMP domain-containing histidine kinase [Oscillospiraceae bacterium]|nr:HAMP domain-containing histidine kinase [Oscillospiraceae bacterium]
MKTFDRIAVLIVTAMVITAFIAVRLLPEKDNGRFMVDVRRIEYDLDTMGYADADAYGTVADIERYKGQSDFYDRGHEYVIINTNGEIYRIDRVTENSRTETYVLILLLAFAAVTAGVFIYVRQALIKPFNRLSEFPHELSKGNLTIPLKEQKSRFFGRFVWGLDMLREKLESSDRRELEQAREEKTLLLSLSHDIKTPLSGIKLYAKALSKGIYTDREKQTAAAESINAHADEIEHYLNEMIGKLRSGRDIEINSREFYLDEVTDRIENYYAERLKTAGTAFETAKHNNCMLLGDPDRLTEVLQNIFENAMKYGDGRSISMTFSDEEDCRLITVTNSGCTLDESELTHIFDSFWRGSNSAGKPGSGLGLHICRRLMHGMGGDIFAETKDGYMAVTAVCRKA